MGGRCRVHRPHGGRGVKRGQKWREQFLVYRKCSVCGGTRLRKEALQFRIGGKNIAEVSALSIEEFARWMDHIEEYLSERSAGSRRRSSRRSASGCAS